MYQPGRFKRRKSLHIGKGKNERYVEESWERFFLKLFFATIKFTKKLACLIKKSQKQLVFLTNLDFINWWFLTFKNPKSRHWSTPLKLIWGRVIGARILGPDGEVMVGWWGHWCSLGNDRNVALPHCDTKSEMPNISIVKDSSFAFQNHDFFLTKIQDITNDFFRVWNSSWASFHLPFCGRFQAPNCHWSFDQQELEKGTQNHGPRIQL